MNRYPAIHEILKCSKIFPLLEHTPLFFHLL